MFGYIKPLTDKKSQEAALNQTFMCGLCLSTKNAFGNAARNLVGNDINFLNVLLHSVDQKEAQIIKGKCISSPIKERTFLQPDDITDRLAVANVLLCYYNVLDDVLDGDARKKIVLAFIKRSFLAARDKNPSLCRSVADRCALLRQKEKANCSNIDEVCDCFASLTREIVLSVKPDADGFLSDLAYNIGKWVYLIDALDDLDKDHRKGNYNPLIACFGGYVGRNAFLTEHAEELQFLFYTVLNSVAQCYNDLCLSKYVCVLNNILYKSIREQTARLLAVNSDEKGEK